MFNLEVMLHRLIYWMPAILIGLTFHEYAHGWAAEKLGDRTARMAGRLTLNPLPHLDPVGFLLLILAGFGWAKPVPVNPYNLRGDKRTGMMLVSMAGPATNIGLALIAAALLSVVGADSILVPFVLAMILVNLILAFFNLLPIPPLDGSKILAGLFPGSSRLLAHVEQYGFIILIILVFSGAISVLFSGVITPVYEMLVRLALGF